MPIKTRYILGILFSILIGSWLQHRFCCCKDSCQKNNTPTITKQESPKTTNKVNTLNGFHFSTPDLTYSCADNFAFIKSQFEILKPISDSVDIGIDKLKDFIKKSNTKFKITGFFTPAEENNSIYPNLGLARATAVKNYFIERGIPENILEIEGKESTTTNNDTLFNAIGLEWLKNDIQNNTESDDTGKWALLKNEINANPIRLYFNTGQSNIEITEEDKVKFSKIIDYLNHVSNAKILVTGHTDNTTGPNNTNEYYSQKRAEFAKDYLIKNGISAQKITAIGKAEKQPIATNDTEEGRAKNRRTDILIE